MLRRAGLAAIVGLGCALGTAASVSAAPRGAMGSTHRFPTTGLTVTTPNWGGYVASAAVPFTGIQSHWVQPSVDCTDYNQAEGFWVGLDGWSDTTVEQGGISIFCVQTAGVWSAQYWAFWEMYPANNPQTLFQVSAGDTIAASVAYSGSTYTIVVDDTTSGRSLTEHEHCDTGLTGLTCNRTSAEWVVERPAGLGGPSLLPAFAPFLFTVDKASTASGGYPMAALSTFSNDPITMVGSAGDDLAVPGSLGELGEGFSMTWLAEQ